MLNAQSARHERAAELRDAPDDARIAASRAGDARSPNARTPYGNAKRDFETFKALDEKKLASAQEVARAKDAMDEAEKRLTVERTAAQGD